jgi:hypothetical protein
MGWCDVSSDGLRTLAALFWLTGSVICGTVCVATALGPVPPDAKAVLGIYPSCRGCEDLPRWNWARWAALLAGVLLGLLKGVCLIWKRVARREAERIDALAYPKAYLFFPRWRLLGLCILCPACVQIQLHTAQFVVSALVFIGLLANVAVFLAIGALRILTGGGLAAQLPNHVARGDYRTEIGQQGMGKHYSTVPDYRKQQALERTRRSKEAAKSEHALGRSMMLQFAINEPLTGPAAGTTGT